MSAIHARAALLPEGWRADIRLTVADGVVASVANAAPEPDDERVEVLIPALANLHSHAFQRAMAGLAERRGPGDDTFWTWREAMYRFGLAMNPDQLEAVAALLYAEMLEAGYARVGEFHYLHHAPDGTPYADVGELAMRIAAAAAQTGIGLTLLPVFYAHGGFGGAAPTSGQRRFISTVDGFARLVAAGKDAVRDLPGAVTGIAPHSLRAVTPGELAAILPLGAGGPVHIHVAEQVREVEDCIAWCGARPVAWLLDNAPVDPNWCAIHATHMTADEAERLVRTGAVAGLCPITEANLGDGVIPADVLHRGRFGIGSDSNVWITLAGELRQLEYAQRLALRMRNVVAAPGGSTGAALFSGALAGGAAATGGSTGIAPGQAADLVALDVAAVPYLAREQVLDHFVFAGRIGVDRVWARGRLVVAGGRHVADEPIAARFRRAMAELVAGG